MTLFDYIETTFRLTMAINKDKGKEIKKFYFRSLKPIERTCKHSDKIEYKMVHDI